MINELAKDISNEIASLSLGANLFVEFENQPASNGNLTIIKTKGGDWNFYDNVFGEFSFHVISKHRDLQESRKIANDIATRYQSRSNYILPDLGDDTYCVNTTVVSDPEHGGIDFHRRQMYGIEITVKVTRGVTI